MKCIRVHQQRVKRVSPLIVRKKLEMSCVMIRVCLLEISYNLDYDITIMTRIDLTPTLFGSLGETYYKEYCSQKGWAYTSLEQIYKNSIHNDKLEFKFGFERIIVKIPFQIQQKVFLSLSPPEC